MPLLDLYSRSDSDDVPKPEPKSKWVKEGKRWVKRYYLQLLDINKEPVGNPIPLPADWKNNPENIMHLMDNCKATKCIDFYQNLNKTKTKIA